MKTNKQTNLQDAITVTSIAKIFKAKVALAFRELVTESLLELGARSTHPLSFEIKETKASQILIKKLVAIGKRKEEEEEENL